MTTSFIPEKQARRRGLGTSSTRCKGPHRSEPSEGLVDHPRPRLKPRFLPREKAGKSGPASLPDTPPSWCFACGGAIQADCAEGVGHASEASASSGFPTKGTCRGWCNRLRKRVARIKASGGSRGTPGVNTVPPAMQTRERPTARCHRTSVRGFLSNVGLGPEGRVSTSGRPGGRGSHGAGSPVEP